MPAEVRLKWYGKKVMHSMKDAASKRILEAANEVRNTVLETLSGDRSGRTYYVPGTRRKYTASAPGQAPATATSELRQSVKASVESEGMEIIGKVRSESKHALPLELGTRKMAARPWLRVSLEKTKPKIRAILRKRWL